MMRPGLRLQGGLLLRGRWALAGSMAFALRAVLIKVAGIGMLPLLLLQVLLCAPLLWLALQRNFRLQDVDTRHWRVHAVRTAFALAANLCLLGAVQQGPVAVAVCFAFTAPLWIELWEWRVTGQLALRSTVSLLLALGGIALLGGGVAGPISGWALLWGALTGLNTAFVNLLTVRLRRERQSEMQIIGWFTYLSFGLGLVCAAGAAAWFGLRGLPWPGAAIATPQAAASAALIAIFALCGQFLMTRSVLIAGLRTSNVWSYFSVLWSMLIGLAALHEQAYAWQAAGTALLLFGSFLGLRASRPLRGEARPGPL